MFSSINIQVLGKVSQVATLPAIVWKVHSLYLIQDIGYHPA